MPDAPRTADEYGKALQAEWGQFVATQPIDIAGARAFNEGDPVPASHVSAGVVREDQVAKASSKAGQAAAEAAVIDTTKKG